MLIEMMTRKSYRQHSELYRGSVGAEQRWHIQSLLACSICRECQLSAHSVCGGPPAAGATLFRQFWCGTKSWWSMHRCLEGRCQIRIYIYIFVSWRYIFLKHITLLIGKQRGSSDESVETVDLTVHILFWPFYLHVWQILDFSFFLSLRCL